MKGTFITFEGIEGSGKSTQIELFVSTLQKNGLKVLITREPGGTEIGDKVRQILLNPNHLSMAPITELLLYAAARAQHVREKIAPALEEGKIVVCDRYADATAAYQGSGRAIDPSLLKELHKIATDNLQPDVTFLLDLEVEEGLKRARGRNKKEGREDRFENEQLEFHRKVREGYLSLAKTEPKRIFVIDASKSVQETQETIISIWEKICGLQ